MDSEAFWGRIFISIGRDKDPVGSVIFGPPDPGLLSTDPDPTCNNRVIFILNKIQTRINKFKQKMMFYNIEFYAYLPKI